MPWWKIPAASGRHATWSGAWVFLVVAEGVATLVCARYKFCDPMLVEVVASPLRVSLNGCRG